VRRLLATVLTVVASFGTSIVATSDAASAARISTRRARAEIERLVETAYPDLPFGNVACPPEVRRAPGATFTCTVQLAGSFLVVDGTFTDDSRAVALATPQAVLSKAALEQFVAANASLEATVDCGLPWIVRRPAQQVTCSAALADGTTRSVTVTVRDAAGNVTITAVI
jgi:hypothetical protein